MTRGLVRTPADLFLNGQKVASWSSYREPWTGTLSLKPGDVLAVSGRDGVVTASRAYSKNASSQSPAARSSAAKASGGASWAKAWAGALKPTQHRQRARGVIGGAPAPGLPKSGDPLRHRRGNARRLGAASAAPW